MVDTSPAPIPHYSISLPHRIGKAPQAVLLLRGILLIRHIPNRAIRLSHRLRHLHTIIIIRITFRIRTHLIKLTLHLMVSNSNSSTIPLPPAHATIPFRQYQVLQLLKLPVQTLALLRQSLSLRKAPEERSRSLVPLLPLECVCPTSVHLSQTRISILTIVAIDAEMCCLLQAPVLMRIEQI